MECPVHADCKLKNLSREFFTVHVEGTVVFAVWQITKLEQCHLYVLMSMSVKGFFAVIVPSAFFAVNACHPKNKQM